MNLPAVGCEPTRGGLCVQVRPPAPALVGPHRRPREASAVAHDPPAPTALHAPSMTEQHGQPRMVATGPTARLRPARRVGGGPPRLCAPVAAAPITELPHQYVGMNLLLFLRGWSTCHAARAAPGVAPGVARRSSGALRDPSWPPDVRPPAASSGPQRAPTPGRATRATRTRRGADTRS